MAGYDSIRIDARGFEQQLQRLGEAPDKLRRAIQLALNTVGRSTRTQSWREIREEINLRPSYISNEVNFIPATLEELRVIIYARKRGVTLSQFPHKQLWRRGKDGKRVKAGVSVSVGKGWTELVEGAFIAPIGPAGGLIAERFGRPRLPLEVLHGPSPSQVLNTKLEDLGADAERKLEAEVRRQLQRIDL
ncbi:MULTISPECIES: phage tail protein [unclassified Pseudomonas]|uniref:phage tail protein n=1 Tax=unclassified Pseudomonas TaxID=196821 RepID=UPI002447818C|nr:MULTISPECIES: phage tail protein [unclassified Pseudomonas]MDG9928531.1 phage tail protein [Pseudomonas sp. GD04042]MDH0482701.1 phage tail protein [Pseudomonas sp. GD04015]MDH0604597.1 phage tail protein [Pseudomonas sp. GD03869]